MLWLTVSFGVGSIAHAQPPLERLQRYDDIFPFDEMFLQTLERQRQLAEFGAKSEWQEKQDKRLEKRLPAKSKPIVPSLRFPVNIERAMQSDNAPRGESRI